MKYVLLAVIAAAALLLGVGVWRVAPNTSINTEAARESTPDPRMQQVEWLRSVTKLENTYTERTYQCMTEMYSLAYTPVSSGPICRESCKLLKQINAMTDPGPAYVDNPKQYYLGSSEVCKERKPTKSNRH